MVNPGLAVQSRVGRRPDNVACNALVDKIISMLEKARTYMAIVRVLLVPALHPQLGYVINKRWEDRERENEHTRLGI